MGVLDQVTKLKKQGYGEKDIIGNLQQQGISPKEITDALNQSKIKSAVSSEETEMQPPSNTNTMANEQQEGYYTPQTQTMQGDYSGDPQMAAAAPQEEYYQENTYAPSSTGMDSETMIEISNQIFSEKIKKTEKRMEDLEEIKTLMQVKVEGIEERLKRIEKMFDALQIQIIEKVGSYGKELTSTKKEVGMLRDTLGKTIKSKVNARKTTSKKRK